MNEKQFNFIVSISSTVIHLCPCLSHLSVWIGCQFALESSFGTSDLAVKYHNICGMRNPMVRISSSRSRGVSSVSWAQYATDFACVLDYVLCVQYHRPMDYDISCIDLYSKFISKFYCPETDYIDKINKIYSKFNSYQNGKEK